jgi:hypothetical protein
MPNKTILSAAFAGAMIAALSTAAFGGGEAPTTATPPTPPVVETTATPAPAALPVAAPTYSVPSEFDRRDCGAMKGQASLPLTN